MRHLEQKMRDRKNSRTNADVFSIAFLGAHR